MVVEIILKVVINTIMPVGGDECSELSNCMENVEIGTRLWALLILYYTNINRLINS